jgi:magnesium-transporting ATPase (P-type)
METNPEVRKIEIEQKTLDNLNTIRKWTMFIAIIGFILLGLLLIIGLIAGTFLSAFKSGETGLGIPESLGLIVIFVVAVIYFFPVFFLFRFSKHTGNAVQTLNKEELHKAFKNLKSYVVYLGILIIIGLSFYVITIIFAGSAIAFLKGLV